jgi:excisionase family DNA binding protein
MKRVKVKRGETNKAELEGKQTYSVAALANTLGVSSALIYGSIARGELRAIRLGRRIMISRATLDSLLRADAPSPILNAS